MRAIVCSDLHGRHRVFEAILHHADFTLGIDRLIVAGDLGDDRDDDAKVLKIAGSLEAEILLGNHELWHIDDHRDHEGIVFPGKMVLDRMVSRQWKLATSVEDILITHAGVSQSFAHRWELDRLDASGVAKRLNSMAAVVGYRIAADDLPGEEGEILERPGPAWYFPSDTEPPMTGVRQVAGHRVPGYQVQWPQVDELERQGFYHIDPGVRYWEDDAPGRTHIRYALIEDGTISVVDEFVD